MRTKQKNMSSLIRKIFFAGFVLFIASGSGWAQNHDLSMDQAANYSSTDPADRKSPDIRIGSEFGTTSTVPDIVQRGVPNDIYGRFDINGLLDHTVVSGAVEIKFYWRNAASATDPPPLISGGSYTHIGTLTVIYNPSDGPFAGGLQWPTNFPSVINKSVSWTPPASGDFFHIAAKVDYIASSGITDDVPGDNTAYSIYVSQSGLMDVVLLHDVSGSMGYYTVGSTSYMDLAKTNAAFFISGMNEADRFAVVAFSSKYAGGSEDIFGTPPPPLRQATVVNKTAAATAVAGMSASGATPLGEGLERAINILSFAPGPLRKRVILLLSDGYENTGSPRACDGANPADPCLGGTLLSQLQTNNIRVFSVGLGTAAWTECLECIADESGGQWYVATTAGIPLAQVYLDMQQAYSADDLYRSDIGISGGNDDTYSIYFEGKDNCLYFMLAWEDLESNLKLKIDPRRLGRSPTKIFKGKGYYVVRVQNPSRGTWKYLVTGDVGKNYLAAVRSDRVGVQLGMDVESEGVVGVPIKVRAKLFSGRRPVTNARLTAEVQVPVGLSLETTIQKTYRNYILKYEKSPIDPKELKRYPDISPRAVFIRKISGNNQENLVKSENVKVILKHIGKGIYTGILPEKYTTTAGKYNVNVTALGRTYHRNFAKQVRIQPGKIDFERSFGEILKIKRPDQEPLWMLRVNAVDHHGNVITCPSLFERTKTEVKDAKLYRKPSIEFGALQHVLTVKPGVKPKLNFVNIDGRKVKILQSRVTR